MLYFFIAVVFLCCCGECHYSFCLLIIFLLLSFSQWFPDVRVRSTVSNQLAISIDAHAGNSLLYKPGLDNEVHSASIWGSHKSLGALI